MELNLTIPGVSGDTQKDIKELRNYIFQLTEQLRYALYNLDVTNFNDLGLARYENGVMQIYTEKLKVAVEEIEVKIKDVDDGFESKFTASAEKFEANFLAKKYLTQDDADGTYLKEEDFESTFKTSAEEFEANFLAKKYLSQDSAAGTYLKQENFESTLHASAEKFVATFVADRFLTEDSADGIYVRDEHFQSKFDLSAEGLKTEFSKTYLSQDAAGKTYVASSVFNQTAETVNTMVSKIGTDGSKLQTRIIQNVKNDEALIQMIASKVNTEGFVTTSTFAVTADAVTAMVSAIGDDGKVTAASIAAKIKDDSSLIKLIAKEVEVDGDVLFTNISEGDGQTEIDGAIIRSQGGSSWDYMEIDGGHMTIGTNGYLGAYDGGIVRLEGYHTRLEGYSDVGLTSRNGCVYFIPVVGSLTDPFQWRITPWAIQHWAPTSTAPGRGEWVTVFNAYDHYNDY